MSFYHISKLIKVNLRKEITIINDIAILEYHALEIWIFANFM